MTVQKVKHECFYCGFEAIMYECVAVGTAEYKCPVCDIGTLMKISDVVTVGPSEVK